MKTKGLKLTLWSGPSASVGCACCGVLALALLDVGHAATWQTFQTDPPRSLTWVYYDERYPTPPFDYPGAWGVPNSWPGTTGDVVTIRHQIELNNVPYKYLPPNGTPVYPFLGGHITADGDPQGLLNINVLNIQPGGWLMSKLEELAFDGDSVWSGGAISAGATSPPGVVHNQGRLSVTGPFVLARGGAGMLNTEHMDISSTFGIEYGALLTNRSGGMPDTSVAEIVLSQTATLVQANSGGGGAGYLANLGVLRKTGSNVVTVGVVLQNDATASRNRAGTVAVDEGTLVLQPSAATSHLRGLKAEIAPGALLLLRGSYFFEPGDVSVTGGGVLRLEPLPGTEFASAADARGTLAAPEGALECAGAFLRNLVNHGCINVTAPSIWYDVINEGHVRLQQTLANYLLTNGAPTDHAAVIDLEADSSIAQPSTGPGGLLRNYALIRKVGDGVSEVQNESVHYGDGGGLRIEAQAGTLRFPNAVTFVNGSALHAGNGATVQFLHRNYVDGGTLSLTGSGKFYLEPGSWLAPVAPPATFTLDSAPGVFDLRGGTLYAPFDNAGELTVTAPTSVSYGFLGYCPLNNSGTIHFAATSSGGDGYAMTLGALTAIVCLPSSTLTFDIAGRPGEQAKWARIRQLGQTGVNYGGTLRINFGDFLPVSGDRWMILENSSGSPENSGDFASVRFANVPAGFVPTFEKQRYGLLVGLETPPACTNYVADVLAAVQAASLVLSNSYYTLTNKPVPTAKDRHDALAISRAIADLNKHSSTVAEGYNQFVAAVQHLGPLAFAPPISDAGSNLFGAFNREAQAEIGCTTNRIAALNRFVVTRKPASNQVAQAQAALDSIDSAASPRDAIQAGRKAFLRIIAANKLAQIGEDHPGFARAGVAGLTLEHHERGRMGTVHFDDGANATEMDSEGTAQATYTWTRTGLNTATLVLTRNEGGGTSTTTVKIRFTSTTTGAFTFRNVDSEGKVNSGAGTFKLS